MSTMSNAGAARTVAEKRLLLEKLLQERRERAAVQPLSFAQQRLWFIDQLQPGSAAYNLPSALRLRGALDVAALGRAFTELVRRHEVLRTVLRGGEPEPVQVIGPPALFPLPVVDLAGRPEPRREAEARRLAGDEAGRPFDLAAGPLARATLVRLGVEDHLLLLTLHHVVTDAWSAGVLVREVGALYEAFTRGLPSPLPEIRFQYADYARWQRDHLRGETLERQLAYWRDRLAGASSPDLPTDRPRPAFPGDAVGIEPFDVGPRAGFALRRLGREEEATSFVVLLAAWQAFLARWSGSDDVCVGSPVAGRTRAELEGLIGFFVNTLVIRTGIPDGASFRELVRRVREGVLGAFSHQDLPFEKLVDALGVERRPGRTPLFDVMFALAAGGGPQPSLGEIRIEGLEVNAGSAQLDLSLAMGGAGEGFAGVLSYRTELWDPATMRRMAGCFATFLEGVARDPDLSLARVPLLAGAERDRAVHAGIGEARPYPRDARVHEVIAARAAARPDAPAVACGGRELSYAELDRRAAELALRLRARGVGPEVPVALFLDRSLELGVAILAVLRAGGAFVPLDTAYPAERLDFLLRDSRARVVLTRGGLAAALPAHGADVVCLDAVPEAPESAAAPDRAGPGNLAYLCYTSGSTGRPKAAMVDHLALLCYAEAMRERMELVPSDRVLQFASPAFDVMIEEVFPAWLGGACVVFPSGELLGSPEELTRVLEAQRVTVFELPTAFWHAWVRVLAEEGASLPASVRLVLMGGERVAPERLAEWARLGVPLLHVFGLTETTVTTTTLRLEAGDDGARWANLPVGRTLPNAEVHVLDPEREPVPAGVAGELYVGGGALARGYWGRPELTAERYVPSPLGGPGARLYRTGDRVRWTADGELEFLGRIDQQVKLRGFRIEPGEVEAALERHPAVREAAVVVREVAGEPRLVAYLAAAEGSRVEPAELRAHLGESLPAYMVPSVFVPLDALPLNRNGKVDRRALPAPEGGRLEAAGTREAPRTPAETVLAGIWAELLGTAEVGIHDNFFELGGDSILSIQVVSRARRAGLHLTPRDLFEHQTVARLAGRASAVAAPARPAEARGAGPAPLTPIQRWFFEQPVPDRHHWNMSLLLRPRRPLDPRVLRRALAALAVHHDALRLRFAREADGAWTQAPAEPVTPVPFHHVDLSALPDGARRAEVSRASAQLQGTLELERGPLLRAAYFAPGAGGDARLLLAVHHLVTDGVSWRILLEDLETVCAQLERGDEAEPEPAGTPFVEWSARLAVHAGAGGFDAELPYWTDPARSGALRLPVDFPGGPDPVEGARTVSVSLTPEETRSLLQEVPAAYRTQVNDALLAALARTLAGWAGVDRVAVDMEGHGREELFPDVDLTRTVGWFTTLFPVLLDLRGVEGPGGTLKAVKEQLRAVPGRGLGYGALRYLGGEEARTALAALPAAEVRFEYLGQFEGTVSAETLFGVAPEYSGPGSAPGEERSHRLVVNGGVVDGALHVRWEYGEGVHRRETVERLAAAYLDALRALIAHCASPEAGGYTPSDFPLAGLDAGEIDRLLGSERGIEDVYPLTPMQEGLLFHTRLAPGEGVYVGQTCLELRGRLDAVAFRRAWQEVLDRHPALRAAFPRAPADVAVQVVRRRVELPWSEEDWRDLAPAEQDAALEDLLRRDRERGFDPEVPPLMRVALLRTGEEAHLLVWSFHQAVLDGWSLPLVFRDLAALYDAGAGGRDPHLPRVAPFREYVAWLRWQDLGRAERHWREVLAGFAAPTPLPGVPARAGAPAGLRQVEVRLATEDAAALRAAARRHGLTENTLVQGAWAILLARYAGSDDVVFGTAVSGRPAELEGVEDMVGLFINTLPVRARVPAGAPILDCLRDLQAQGLSLREHEYAPLVRVTEWSDVDRGAPLFETVMAFENYPDASGPAAAERALVVRRRAAREQGSYPLSLSVESRAELAVRVRYEGSRLDPEGVERLSGHLRTLLHGLAAGPERHVGELPMLGAAERETLLHAWNGVDTGYEGDLCIHERVRSQVLRTPDAVALEFEGESLTYSALDRRANALAALLRDRGVGPEVRVGICMEPSTEMILAMLAVLKAGGGYLPLDPELPGERLGFMLADARPSLVLTQAALAGRLADSGVPVLCLDSGSAAATAEAEAAPRSGVGPDHLAYVIYTSGSTGRPKGVMVEHRGVGNTFLELARLYEAGPGERNLLFAPLHFDASVADVFVALCSGATLVVARREAMLPGEDLARLLREKEITHLKITPSALAVLPVEPLPALRAVITGGEACSAELMERWAPGRRYYNGYGATEASIRTVSARYADSAQAPPLGRPVPNTRLYVLGAELEPVPVGVAGELYIGGVGVVRGYLGRPGLTAERFVPDPFGGVPGARLYRTGDLGRRRSDGEVEFVGRVDFQVKVRGFRVELGEIEAALREHPEVREAAVLLREDKPDDPRLVAYVVPEAGAVSASDLKRSLKERLPEYMVPSAYVSLDALPITSNGKLDRRTLPAPEDGGGEGAYAAPRTATEEIVAGIWGRVLGTGRVGVHDGFFDLGGHSLLATRAMARTRDAFGIDLPLRALFEAPTLVEFATRVDAARREGSGLAWPPLVPAPRDRPVPLSLAQQRLWFFDRMEPGSAVYNVPGALRLRGALDVDALRRALTELERRHEALRTVFRTVDHQAVQVVRDPAPVELPLTDLCGLPEAAREAEARRRVEAEAGAPFDLETGPLFRTRLLRLGDGDHVLAFTIHHVVSDGWSTGVLVREVSALYRAFSRGEASPLPELPVQYADYAVWQRGWLSGGTLERYLDYWKTRLAGAPTVLELPGDHPRPARQSFRGGWRSRDLPSSLVEALETLGRGEAATLYMVLLGAFAALLLRYTGRQDLVVGTPTANRGRAELEELIGFFVNMLPLRVELEGNPTFRELVAQVRETSLGAFAHEDVPFDLVVQALEVEREPGRPPLVQVAFALQNAPAAEVDLPGIRVARFGFEAHTVKFDLELTVSAHALGASLGMAYNAALFEPATVDSMLSDLAALLETAAREPDARVLDLAFGPGDSGAPEAGPAGDEAEEFDFAF